MKSRYLMFAAYNVWCNERLYDAAAKLPETDYRADRGAFFKSMHGTLNHLLLGDRIWMRRFTGNGEHPPNLDATLYDDFAGLRAARRTEDERIFRYIGGLSETDLAGTIRYRTIAQPVRSSRCSVPRSIISSTTRPITADRRTACSPPSPAMRPPST